MMFGATRSVALGVALATLVPLAGVAEARSAQDAGSAGVGEWQVSFEVVNKNDSRTAQWCTGDGETYTVRGSLVGPPGVRAGQFDAVTLYVPGSGDASIWHFPAPADVTPRVDHVTEMARLGDAGHASVSLHPLGYGPSDPVNGDAVCYGTYADHVAQIIEHLRDGSYRIDGGSAPAFGRVALAGHSGGGIVAELTQMSFAAADALIVTGVTDYGLGVGGGVADDLNPLLPFPYGSVVHFVRRCATARESKRGKGGWAFLFASKEELEMLDAHMDEAVVNELFRLYERDFCSSDGSDYAPATATNIAFAPKVEVPVLVGSGVADPVAPPAAVKLQHARYALVNDDVTSFAIPESGHQVMMNRSAPVFRAILHRWLEERGF